MVEALVRWEKEGGMESPEDILSIAEYYGHIVKIDICVLEKVCRDYQRLQEMGIDYISINLSTRTVIQKNMVESFAEIIDAYAIPYSAFSFEITETAIIENETRTMANIAKLKKLGAKVSLDDFCTGYSSLNQLSDLNVDGIKINRSFISGVGFDEKMEATISGLVQVCEDFDLSIIAEGVETKEQQDYLIEMGCDYLQGYFFSEPMMLEELQGYLQEDVAI